MSIDNTGNNRSKPPSSKSSTNVDLPLMINPASALTSNSFETFLQGANRENYSSERGNEDRDSEEDSHDRSSKRKRDENGQGGIRKKKAGKNVKTKKSPLALDKALQAMKQANSDAAQKGQDSSSNINLIPSKSGSFVDPKALGADHALQQMENLAPQKRALKPEVFNYLVQQISTHVKDDNRREVFIRFHRGTVGGELTVRIRQAEKGVKVLFEGDADVLSHLEANEGELSRALLQKGGTNYILEFA